MSGSFRDAGRATYSQLCETLVSDMPAEIRWRCCRDLPGRCRVSSRCPSPYTPETRYMLMSMGAKAGGGDRWRRVPQSRNQRGLSLRNQDISPSPSFFLTHRLGRYLSKFRIFQYFPNKVAEIRRETKFWGKWGWVPMNPSPNQKFVATPLLMSHVSSRYQYKLMGHEFVMDEQ